MKQSALETFVIIDGHPKSVRRLKVSADLQESLTKLFVEQELAFLGDPTPHTIVTFDPGYTSDPDELQEISGFSDELSLHQAIKSPLSIPIYNQKNEKPEYIRAIFSGYILKGKSRVLIQKFDRRRVISTEGLSIFSSGQTFKKLEHPGLILDKRLASVLVDNSIIFRNFANARMIFDLVKYFDEATDLQTAKFFGFKSADLPEAKQLMSMADSWVRKKIALISRAGPIDISRMSSLTKDAATYGLTLQFSGKGKNKKLIFPEKKADLKKLLRFIDEDYYQSIVNPSNLYYSNSKKRV